MPMKLMGTYRSVDELEVTRTLRITISSPILRTSLIIRKLRHPAIRIHLRKVYRTIKSTRQLRNIHIKRKLHIQRVEHLIGGVVGALFGLIENLGLGHRRTKRLVNISQAFLSPTPPTDLVHRSRGKTTTLYSLKEGDLVVKKVQYPPTVISHIPGCGPYALDSYRIFCTTEDEWMSVRPTDKELRRYLVRLFVIFCTLIFSAASLEMEVGDRKVSPMGPSLRSGRVYRSTIRTQSHLVPQ